MTVQVILLLQVTIDGVRDVFDVFAFVITLISCVPFSPGSAEAHIG